MKRIIINLLVVLQIFCLSSCLTTKQTNLLREPGGDIPHYSVDILKEEYRVKVGDDLSIMLTFNPMDMQTAMLFRYFSTEGAGGNVSSNGPTPRSFPVAADGTIYFPYLGAVSVEGKTTLEIQQNLEKRINEGIAEDCFVKVSLGSRFYSVIGESGVGCYPIAKDQMTIYQALSQSRDILPYGDRKHIKIIRELDNTTIVKTFDLRTADIVNSEFYYIQPNDIIYVQPLGRKFIGINSFGAIFAMLSGIVSLGLVCYKAYTMIK